MQIVSYLAITHFMQGDNLHEMSNPIWQKNKKNMVNLSSA